MRGMQPLIVRLLEALMCLLVLLLFLAIYLSKLTLPRWEPRVPEAPPCSVQLVGGGAEDSAKDVDADVDPHGAKDVVLLLHGYAASPQTFPDTECVAPLLREGRSVALPTYRRRTDGPRVSLARVVIHSLLAHLPRDALPVSVETMAADLVVLINERGWERVHVVGHSMGGMVAQALAIEIPDKIASLTTVGSCTGPGLGPCGPRPFQLMRDGVRVMCPKLWRRVGGVGGGTGGGPVEATADKRRSERARSEWGQRQVAAIITSRGRAGKLDALVRRGRLHAPILAVSGDQDTQVAPGSAAAAGRRITGCRSVVVGGMGHTPKNKEWTEVLRLAGLVGHPHSGTARPRTPNRRENPLGGTAP